MSLGIDAMFVAAEYGALKQGSSDAWSRSPVGITLVLSGYLNALAFSHGSLDQGHVAAMVFGIFIPTALFLSTNRLAKLR